MGYMPCENCGVEDPKARIKEGTGTLLCRKCLKLCKCQHCGKLVRSLVLIPGTKMFVCSKCNRRIG